MPDSVKVAETICSFASSLFIIQLFEEILLKWGVKTQKNSISFRISCSKEKNRQKSPLFDEEKSSILLTVFLNHKTYIHHRRNCFDHTEYCPTDTISEYHNGEKSIPHAWSREERDGMELPKQKKLYSDLETRFTDLESLTKELRKRKLTGLLKLTFDACEGVIFFDEGGVIDGYEIFRDEMPVKDRGGRSIVERSKIESGTIDVYELPRDILQIYVMTLRERPNQRLHTMYTDFRKLLIFLERHRLYGTLEVRTSQGKGYVLLDAGKPVDVFFCDMCGSDALDQLLDLVDKEDVEICIYSREGGVQ